ncbi:hypothetical protein Gotri_018831, partial [Gossypium trilobum]|nr:hypothetical protein [Gossypium trilobum]
MGFHWPHDPIGTSMFTWGYARQLDWTFGATKHLAVPRIRMWMPPLQAITGVDLFWKSHVPTPLVVEAWAFLEAIQFTKEMGFRRVEFEGDSLFVITKMKSTITDRFDISMLIWEAKLAGHLMAKEGFHWQCNSWWVEDGPVTIHGVVHVELLHVRRV